MLDSLLIAKIIDVGTFDSRIHFSGQTITKPRFSCNYELELLTEDGGSSFIDDVEYPVKKGNLLFVRPNQKRFSKLHFKSWFIRFSLPMDTDFSYFHRVPSCMDVADFDEYVDLFNEIATHFFSCDKGINLLVDSCLLKLFHKMYNSSIMLNQDYTPNGNVNTAILNAKKYIDENYSQNLTLETIAEHCHLSPIYFHKKFVSLVGMTPHKYILMRRINTSKRLLLASDFSLAKIAFDCGFTSQSYFSYIFKKETGTSPGQFRKSVNYPDCFQSR